MSFVTAWLKHIDATRLSEEVASMVPTLSEADENDSNNEILSHVHDREMMAAQVHEAQQNEGHQAEDHEAEDHEGGGEREGMVLEQWTSVLQLEAVLCATDDDYLPSSRELLAARRSIAGQSRRRG
jgi:hypothetical protein